MMKIIKKIYGVILLLVLVASIDCFASTKTYVRTEDNYLVPEGTVVNDSNKWNVMNTPAVDASEKVYDFADLLTDVEEVRLYGKITEYVRKYSLDLAIVTINVNSKGSAMSYAHDFYEYNMFDYDGSLMLIDMANREVYMVTSGTAIDLYVDSRINTILENVFGSLSDGQYYEACSKFINLCGSFASMGITDGYDDIVVSEDGTIKKDLHLGAVFIFALIGTILIVGIMAFTNRMVKKATSSREYLVKETVNIVHVSEKFMGSHVSKTPISDGSSSGGRGGSSVRSGSGGRSFGGGGRKF